MDILNFKDFTQALTEEVGMHLQGKEINVRDITKNNGVILKGMIITEKDNPIAPTIYLEPFYEKYKVGTELEDVADEIVATYEHNKTCDLHGFEISRLLDYDKIREQLRFKLVNYNKNIEQFKEYPHRQVLDLMVVYYIDVSLDADAKKKASITVNDRLFNGWNITEEELWKTAIVNTAEKDKIVISSMMDIMNQMMELDEVPIDEQVDEGAVSMYVVTNQKKINGAGAILYPDALKQLRDYLKADYYILPSSTHEIIAIPKSDDIDVKGLIEMVHEVNSTQVAEDEILSDNIYCYEDGELKLIAA